MHRASEITVVGEVGSCRCALHLSTSASGTHSFTVQDAVGGALIPLLFVFSEMPQDVDLTLHTFVCNY